MLFFILCCIITLISCQKPLSIEKFSGSRGVLMGKESSLSWEVKNAQKIILKNNDTGEEQVLEEDKGRYKFRPQEDFSYTLIAESKTQKITKDFEGKILKNPPVIEYFRGSKEYEVGTKKMAYLEWNVRNAKRIYLKRIADNLPEIFRADSLTPDTTTTFELVAIGEFGDTVSKIHTIQVLKQNYNIAVTDAFKTKTLAIGIDNNVKWSFPNAEWVMREFSKDTLVATGIYKVNPIKSSEGIYKEKFYVKYLNHSEPSVFVYEAFLEDCKIFFKPSKLKVDVNTPVILRWNTLGTRKYEIILDGTVIKTGTTGEGSHTVTIRKNVEATLRATDAQGKIHEVTWTIKSGVMRPFIVNAIDYKTIKNESKKRRLIYEIFQTDRSNYPEEIKLRILVTDTLGNFIQGLAPPSISDAESRKFFRQIIEKAEGQTQKIDQLTVREVNELQSVPYDVAFSLDYSGSMIGDIKALEKALRRMMGKKSPEDRFSIIRFDDKIRVETALEADVNQILNNIPWNGIEDFGGSTALYASGDRALRTLKASEDRQKLMFLFTDGYENSSFAYAEDSLAYTAYQLVKKARVQGVKVYPIVLGESTNEKVLDAIGRLTDGYTMYVKDNSRLDSAYAEVPRLFKNYYEITYKPMVGPAKDKMKDVTLLYYNNQTIKTATSKYIHGDDFQLDEYESSEKGKNIIVPFQVVAFFQFDRYDLQIKFMPNMEAIYKLLTKNPDYKIDILGHTDQVGTDEKNIELSKLRAISVQQYLVSKGIDISRIHIKALGKSRPVWVLEDEEWKAQENRRIEVEVWQ